MIIVFWEADDKSGEGIRAEIEEFEDRQKADERFHLLCDIEDVREAKMYVGNPIHSYNRDLVDSRLLTGDELRASALEDIDDIENKEGLV